jgi:Domain of unknown function (DUF4082)/Bacterial Ig-like domain
VFVNPLKSTPAPTVTNQSPALGATNVPIGVPLTATFSEAVQSSTISFTLTDPNNNIVPATLTYNSSTFTAILRPNALLSSLTTYTGKLSGAQDMVGNTMSPVSWSFTTKATDTTPPSVPSENPSPGATGVPITTTVTATFSKALLWTKDDTNQTPIISFVLTDPNNNVVPATLSYNDTTYVATLTPSNPLSPATTYTVTINGAEDLSGNVMSSPVSWSFTTAAAVTNATIWSSTATPANPSQHDSSAIELGVKFDSDVAGSITGIRFYKGSGNTGTHVGHLWTSTGTLLATATFTNETASGWQQVNFSTPVAITAGTTYTASYFAPVGHYAADNSYFASSGVNKGLLKNNVAKL